MKGFKTFEDSKVWQEARELVRLIYQIVKNTSFSKDYALRDQICRAAVSVMSNISEGSERQTDKEFVQFLFIAKGSVAEVRSQLYIALDMDYISKHEFTKLTDSCVEISRMLFGLIQHLKSKK